MLFWVTAAASSEVENLRGAMEDMFLSPEELEEFALRSLWLARYWRLAEQYGKGATQKSQGEGGETQLNPPPHS